MYEKFISFVILCSDSAHIDLIKDCLTSIKQQDDKDYEWIVLGDITNKYPSCMCHVCLNPSMIKGRYLLFIPYYKILASPSLVAELKVMVENAYNDPQWITFDSDDKFESAFIISTELYKKVIKECTQNKYDDCMLAKKALLTSNHTIHLSEAPVVYGSKKFE